MPYVLAGLWAFANVDCVTLTLDVFLKHDRVRAAGQVSASEDAAGSVRLQLFQWDPSAALPHDAQAQIVPGRREIRNAQAVSIHGARVGVGNRLSRYQVFGKNAAQRRGELNSLGLEHASITQDLSSCVFKLQHIEITCLW
jgi:hypothetical protein